MKKLAIVTVDYNGHADTQALLESARKLETRGLDVKWLVVDNASDEAIPLEWEKKYGVEIIQTGENLGFAGGYNRGIKYAYWWGADYVLVVNNDTLIGDTKLASKMITAVDENNAGLASPKIMFAPGYEFYKDRYTKEQTGRVIWYAGGYFDTNNVFGSHRGVDEVDSGQYNGVEETEFANGCCLLIPRRTLKKVGYFRDELFAYFDDVDYAWRVKSAGQKQIYVGTTQIYHKVSQTAGVGSEITDYYHTRNRLWFGFTYMSMRTKLALLREAAKMLIVGRAAQRRGVWDFLRGRYGRNGKGTMYNVKFPVELSIVILEYKTKVLLENLLKSLTKFPHSSMEVVVVDNSPGNGAAEMIKSRYKWVKLIEPGENTGFPKGNNIGTEYTRGEYVLFLNSDIEVTQGCLEKLVKTAAEKKAVTAGDLKFPNGDAQDSCFVLPNFWGAFKEFFLGQKGSYFLFRPKSDEPVAVEGAVMACLLVPRWVWNKIGQMWHEAFIYFEDLDYCRRLKRAGIPIYYVPGAEFLHHHGAASKQQGLDWSNEFLVKAAKAYHGTVGYWLLYWTLWLGQKWNHVKVPTARWKSE